MLYRVRSRRGGILMGSSWFGFGVVRRDVFAEGLDTRGKNGNTLIKV